MLWVLAFLVFAHAMAVLEWRDPPPPGVLA
jgi:hypothetical protein